MAMIQYLDAKWYPEFQASWDAIAFRERILPEINSNEVVLDIGAGRGGTPFMDFSGLTDKIIGTDVDSAVLENPQLDLAFHNPDGSLAGVNDESIDVTISKDVLEHVATPEIFFREIARVLKPGGIFLAKTPNKTHYVPFFARITPLWFHKSFNKMRGREVHDTFPTTYLCNTRKDIQKWAVLTGLELEYVEFQEGRPEYLRFSPPSYLIGFLYERLVNRFGWESFKSVLYIKMKKA